MVIPACCWAPCPESDYEEIADPTAAVGDVAVLYTDGIFHPQRQAEEWGFDRFRAVVAREAGKGPQADRQCCGPRGQRLGGRHPDGRRLDHHGRGAHLMSLVIAGPPPEHGTCILDEKIASRPDLKEQPSITMPDSLSEHGQVVGGDLNWLHLCLEETLVNAMVHGNEGDPDLPVTVTIWDDGDIGNWWFVIAAMVSAPTRCRSRRSGCAVV